VSAEGKSTNKVEIPKWNDPIPELRSRSDQLAVQLKETKSTLEKLAKSQKKLGSKLENEMTYLEKGINTELSKFKLKSTLSGVLHSQSIVTGGGNAVECTGGEYASKFQTHYADSNTMILNIWCAPFPELNVKK
jgi:hypothetical protein